MGIRPEELRIGNWVATIYATPHRIDGSDLYAMDKSREQPSPIFFDPIPFTPSILEKCGFNCRQGSSIYRRDISYIDEDYPCSLQLSGSGIQIARSGIGAICAPVFNLHQLQNLFWCLTGEELNYKP